MRKKIWLTFILILILSFLAGLIDWPSGPNFFGREIKAHLGLDLQGGVHLVYELDTSNLKDRTPAEAQRGAIQVLQRRIDGLGVSEPVIQATKIGGKVGVIIELPGIKDVNHAKKLIGQTAQLKFLEQNAEGQFVETELTGAHVKKAAPGTTSQSQSQTGFAGAEPVINLTMTAEGGKLFADITKRNLQKPLAIQLDERILTAPIVQAEITDGNAIITGLDFAEAKELSGLINAGALPTPIKIVSETKIEPTLGKTAVEKSLLAGILGIFLVGLLMVIYYRLPGFIAMAALFIYTLVVLAIFKLIPVTLTLAGIAGFILSVGMAVDANILIFERLKEELGQGKELNLALEEAFRRAWPSIRDSNISSIITAIILYYGTTGLVRGFAVTLMIGIIISMFTAITVSRTFLRIFLRKKYA